MERCIIERGERGEERRLQKYLFGTEQNRFTDQDRDESSAGDWSKYWQNPDTSTGCVCRCLTGVLDLCLCRSSSKNIKNQSGSEVLQRRHQVPGVDES